MSHNDRPTALLGPAGAIVDDSLIDATARKRLVDLLREGSIEGDQADRFIAACIGFATSLSLEDQAPTAGAVCRQLAYLRDQAARLRVALSGLSPEAADAVNSRVLLALSGSDRHRDALSPQLEAVLASGRSHPLLALAWDAVLALEAYAEDCAQMIGPTVRLRATEAGGRSLLQLVLDDFERRFGRLPPSAEGGWFVSFMQVLGDASGLVCGPRPVRAAISQRSGSAAT